MKPVFIPQPKKVAQGAGFFKIARKGTIGVPDIEWRPAARDAQEVFSNHDFAVTMPGMRDDLRISKAGGFPPGGYRLAITGGGVKIEAGDLESARSAVRTLLQVAAQSPAGSVKCLSVTDWPDFADRGVYYDVTRGRVPTVESLKKQADLLARFKINHLQYYVEDVFRFRGHPLIGRKRSPLSAADIIELDAYCAKRGIDLVPSLAAFGHMHGILTLKPYRHLAEDYGVGKLVSKEGMPRWFTAGQGWALGWSLAVGNPKSYEFLDSLFAEFLPCFRSKWFNVCCDEVFDMGCGQSYKLAKRLGKGELFLRHILKLRDLAAKYGKKIMIWGDIIKHYPSAVRRLPKDITVLDWGYDYNFDFKGIRKFTKTGLATHGCPGTSSWSSLFPRVPQSLANIAGFAAAGKRYGARGILNTDWGDGGHFNFMEFSWIGYLFGAEQAWNAGADKKSFIERFCRLFLGTDRGDLVRAVKTLCEVSAPTRLYGPGHQLWLELLTAAPGGPLYAGKKARMVLSRDGRVVEADVALDAVFARKALTSLAKARSAIAKAAKSPKLDSNRVLDYWVFAIDTMAHAARRLAAFGRGGKDTPAIRRRLKAETRSLEKRFVSLWLARNRVSDMMMTVRRYRKAAKLL